jgi:hypothetical protein
MLWPAVVLLLKPVYEMIMSFFGKKVDEKNVKTTNHLRKATDKGVSPQKGCIHELSSTDSDDEALFESLIANPRVIVKFTASWYVSRHTVYFHGRACS